MQLTNPYTLINAFYEHQWRNYGRQMEAMVVLAVQRFGVGLVIERSLVRLPAGALSSQLGQLSLPSLRGRQIEYQPARLGLRRGAFACVGWQVKLCDPGK